jgi:hypothetical protein
VKSSKSSKVPSPSKVYDVGMTNDGAIRASRVHAACIGACGRLELVLRLLGGAEWTPLAYDGFEPRRIVCMRVT